MEIFPKRNRMFFQYIISGVSETHGPDIFSNKNYGNKNFVSFSKRNLLQKNFERRVTLPHTGCCVHPTLKKFSVKKYVCKNFSRDEFWKGAAKFSKNKSLRHELTESEKILYKIFVEIFARFASPSRSRESSTARVRSP